MFATWNIVHLGRIPNFQGDIFIAQTDNGQHSEAIDS